MARKPLARLRSSWSRLFARTRSTNPCAVPEQQDGAREDRLSPIRVRLQRLWPGTRRAHEHPVSLPAAPEQVKQPAAKRPGRRPWVRIITRLKRTAPPREQTPAGPPASRPPLPEKPEASKPVAPEQKTGQQKAAAPSGLPLWERITARLKRTTPLSQEQTPASPPLPEKPETRQTPAPLPAPVEKTPVVPLPQPQPQPLPPLVLPPLPPPPQLPPRPLPSPSRDRDRAAYAPIRRRSPRSRRTRGCVGRAASTLLFLSAIVIGGWSAYSAYNFFNTTQNTYATQIVTLRDLLPLDNLKIYDSQGRLLDQLTDQGMHTDVPYDQITPDLVNATISIEDKTFWDNTGLDLMGILRAALADLENGRAVEGGSTITQQLVKQLVVGNSSDITRKLSEIILAPQVTERYSKQDILEMYLNTIYYGHQAYGIDAAANVYFGLQDQPGQSAASQLDLAQAAMLAGLPRNAWLYDPAVSLPRATARFKDVLNALITQGYISQTQAQDAIREEQGANFFAAASTPENQAPHFDTFVLAQLEQQLHLTRNQLSRSGLTVTTTLNVALQQQILTVMQQHIASIRTAHHVTNAAEVLIDFHTGAILSMLGSLDYNDESIDGQFNVALAYRQPGSSFKPYVYATAFAQGASPAQAVDDAPTIFANPDGHLPAYEPHNDDTLTHGHMTLRCALQNSLNIPSVRVLQKVGIEPALATAQAMGISSYTGTPGLALVLGSLGVRLLDQTSAFGVFADNGVRQPYYAISQVVQRASGKVLFQHRANGGTRVLSPQVAYMTTSVLSDNASRVPTFSACSYLQLYSHSQQACLAGAAGTVRPAAAKTGTTQNSRDGWTVGYTTDYVMGVWTGNNDNSPMSAIAAEESAAPIWHNAMLLAEQGRPVRDFQNPGGLLRASVTYPDGVTSTDWYLTGHVPASTPPPAVHTNAHPLAYCSTFAFAFAPPAGDGIPASGAWW
ncbi:MAG TPA: transglycosylase domain-containing protein [Ktedonobacteraceae bacterium]